MHSRTLRSLNRVAKSEHDSFEREFPRQSILVVVNAGERVRVGVRVDRGPVSVGRGSVID